MPLRRRKQKPGRKIDKKGMIREALNNRLFAVSNSELVDKLSLDTVDRPEDVKDIDPERINSIDLPRLSSIQLSRWLQYCTAMLSYSLVTAAEAENKLSVANSLYSSTKARKTAAALIGDKTPKWKIDSIVESDEELKELDQRLKELVAIKTLAKAHTQVWEVRASLFSREVSRRASEKSQGI